MDSTALPRTLLGLMPSLADGGKRLVDAGELYQFLSSLFGTGAPLVPTGTTLATATPLPNGINVIGSATATGAATVLPPARLPGQVVTVINNGATGVLVYPTTPDQIISSDTATPAGTAIDLTNAPTWFTCIAPGVWKQSLSA